MRKNSLFIKAVGAFAAIMIGALSFGKVDVFAKEELTGHTATELVTMFEKGYNIGNTFDATGGNKSDIYSFERSWGNPPVNEELMAGIKAAGFTIVRIPITWQKHVSKDGTYKIDEAFLNRLKEVVDYAFDNELFVIINMHHEDWLNTKSLGTDYEKIGEELSAIWAQVADFFADYDQHLIFEAMNEPRAVGTSYEWTGTEQEYKAINYLNQLFVNEVRGNGKGHNPERALMLPGYAASNSTVVFKSIEIPTWNGKPVENAMISVHCYSPYNFCLTDTQNTFDPTLTSDTSDITRMISDLKSIFINNGIPVIIGECGATNSNNNLEERLKWFNYFGEVTRKAGIPAIVWDNGVNGITGGENHSYINRKTGEQVNPELIDAFINGIKEEVTNTFIDFEPYKSGDEIITVTARSVGFVPSKLMNQAKVNHTPDAASGFSLKVDSGFAPDGKVTLDISKYEGLNLKITAYVLSDDNRIAAGIEEAGKMKEYAASNVKGEWTELSFYTTAADEQNLYFIGNAGTVYNLDDISIEIVDTIPTQKKSVGIVIPIVAGIVVLAVVVVICLRIFSKKEEK